MMAFFFLLSVMLARPHSVMAHFLIIMNFETKEVKNLHRKKLENYRKPQEGA